MKSLTKADEMLIEEAKNIIKSKYKRGHTRHTGGCAIRMKSGDIVYGINLDGIHSICAEQTAISGCYTRGQLDFDTIVAVGVIGKDFKVLAPCGNCRQFLSEYAPSINIIIDTDAGKRKVSLDELLPHRYIEHVKTL